MLLIDDAKWVIRNAWSVRFNILAAALGGVSATVGFLLLRDVEFPIGPVTLSFVGGGATFLASVAALAARFVKQPRAALDTESGDGE